jgi:glutaredoxin
MTLLSRVLPLLEGTLQKAVQSRPLIAFTKSYCPTCKDVEERLDDANADPKIIALDKLTNGNEVRDVLRQTTSQEHVPYVFAGWKFLPALELIRDLKSGEIKGTLLSLGVKADGFFRP